MAWAPCSVPETVGRWECIRCVVTLCFFLCWDCGQEVDCRLPWSGSRCFWNPTLASHNCLRAVQGGLLAGDRRLAGLRRTTAALAFAVTRCIQAGTPAHASNRGWAAKPGLMRRQQAIAAAAADAVWYGRAAQGGGTLWISFPRTAPGSGSGPMVSSLRAAPSLPLSVIAKCRACRPCPLAAGWRSRAGGGLSV